MVVSGSKPLSAFLVACFSPIEAYQTASGDVLFVERTGADYVRTLQLPCGQCVGCRLERARQWAIRCVHEASLHEANCFVTLTYRDDDLPPGGSLRYRDFQLFMKRLRRARPKCRIRFFVGGEYGELLSRPHFHALLFNCSFPDQVRLTDRLFRSAELERLWPHGMSSIGAVTFESASYVARYCLKKITGKHADAYYGDKAPELGRMSLRPAVGRTWFERFWRDVRSDGKVVSRGRKMRMPRYYDGLLDGADPDASSELRASRELLGVSRRFDNTDERLAVREEVTRARLNSKGSR